MKKWLLIDDQKRWDDVLNISIMYGETPENTHPGVEFHQAKTYWEGRNMLAQGGWDWVYIDHELGGRGDETGYQILEFLELNPELIPAEMNACSGHSGHKGKMWEIMQRLTNMKKGLAS
jgi:hypothetical protein